MGQPQSQHYPHDVDAVQGGKALYDDIVACFQQLGDTPERAHAIAHMLWPDLIKTFPTHSTLTH